MDRIDVVMDRSQGSELGVAPRPTHAIDASHAVATASARGSCTARILGASSRLTGALHDIFERLYVTGQTKEQVACELGLSPEEFSRSHGQLLRSLKRAAL